MKHLFLTCMDLFGSLKMPIVSIQFWNIQQNPVLCHKDVSMDRLQNIRIKNERTQNVIFTYSFFVIWLLQ